MFFYSIYLPFIFHVTTNSLFNGLYLVFFLAYESLTRYIKRSLVNYKKHLLNEHTVPNKFQETKCDQCKEK